MSVVVRFAPSPTGMLHIGGARTAIFNYLFAKKNNGKFLLRIEDTDKTRSTSEATQAILDGLSWLGIKHDDDIVLQSKNIQNHIDAVEKMIKNGTAYYAYDSIEEIEEAKKNAEKNGKTYRYNAKWRDGNLEMPKDIKPVVRLKIPSGTIEFNDSVRGLIKFECSEIEDLVLMRSDGTPTYMLAVVVDDIDMKITHVIRGEDHISNTPKQILIYKALDAKIPQFAHIPLIYDIHGQKLSKRKNAVSTFEYKKMGYLPDAIFNYLLRLGWSFEDKEFFTRDEAINCFDLNGIGKSPSRFDFEKLNFVNLNYLQKMENKDVFDLIKDDIATKLQRDLSEKEGIRILKILTDLKKANNLNEICDNCFSYCDVAFELNEEGLAVVKSNKVNIEKLCKFLETCNVQNAGDEFKVFLKDNNLKFGELGPLLRLCLIGKKHSSGIGAMIEAFGVGECIARLNKFL